MNETRSVGGGLVDCPDEECITLMAKVISARALHLQAADGNKKTGTTVKFDGTEDHPICKEAKVFWYKYNVRAMVDKAVDDVKQRIANNKLMLDYKNKYG